MTKVKKLVSKVTIINMYYKSVCVCVYCVSYSFVSS